MRLKTQAKIHFLRYINEDEERSARVEIENDGTESDDLDEYYSDFVVNNEEGKQNDEDQVIEDEEKDNTVFAPIIFPKIKSYVRYKPEEY